MAKTLHEHVSFDRRNNASPRSSPRRDGSKKVLMESIALSFVKATCLPNNGLYDHLYMGLSPSSMDADQKQSNYRYSMPLYKPLKFNDSARPVITMPSIDEIYKQSLLHPIVDGEEKSPTIVSVLMILLSRALKPQDLPPPEPDEETDCPICRVPLRDATEDLVVLTCGHTYCCTCADDCLHGVKQWSHTIPPDETMNEAEDGEVAAFVDHNEQIDEERRVIKDIDRTCAVCRHIIVPADDGTTQYEEGIAPEEAEWILRYFDDEQHGKQRKARLTENATVGVEFHAAQKWAREQYTPNFWAGEDEKETFKCIADDERKAERDEAADSDYAPSKEKPVKRSIARLRRPAHPKRNNKSNGRKSEPQKPQAVYIDLTQDSDGDQEMTDAADEATNTTIGAGGEDFLSNHTMMRASDYLQRGKRKRIIERDQARKVIKAL